MCTSVQILQIQVHAPYRSVVHVPTIQEAVSDPHLTSIRVYIAFPNRGENVITEIWRER